MSVIHPSREARELSPDERMRTACQVAAHEPAEIEFQSQSPDGPYLLCSEHYERLRTYSLRPLEWYTLATIHGPCEHYLHDDLYENDGTACQPHRPVVDPEAYPAPRLEAVSADLERLMDFALTRWQLDDRVQDALKGHERESLLRAIADRHHCTRNAWFHRRLVEIGSTILGRAAEGWLRSLLTGLPACDRLMYLYYGHGCFSREDGAVMALDAVSNLPPEHWAQQCMVLSRFREPAYLVWIERNVRDPLIEAWGILAAASGLTWERAAQWIEAGRPLSLVALDAMATCVSRPGQASLVRQISPRIHAETDLDAIESVLRQYAERDRVPRVRHLVGYIIKNLSAIIVRGGG